MMRRSLVLDTVLDGVFRAAIVFSLFLFFAGHNAPGGGFIGGLVAGAALVLRYVAGGAAEVRRVVSLPAETVLGAGLVLSVATGMAGWLLGSEFFESRLFEAELPVLGTLKASSALFFDAGVYLVVVGTALAVLTVLGERAAD
jgi:multisubunit Na+/H+ antiporter MnhB subunit